MKCITDLVLTLANCPLAIPVLCQPCTSFYPGIYYSLYEKSLFIPTSMCFAFRAAFHLCYVVTI